MSELRRLTWEELADQRTKLLEAIEGLGAMPEGYCFCYGHGRNATKPDHEHTGECQALRAAIAKAKGESES